MSCPVVKPMRAVLYIIAGPLFLISIAAHLYVRLRLRPKDDQDQEDYYDEFEDEQPDVARYLKWSRITFVAATIAVLLLFAATFV
jgi:hypothetical protein